MEDKGEDARTTPLPAGMPTRHSNAIWCTLAFIEHDKPAMLPEHERVHFRSYGSRSEWCVSFSHLGAQNHPYLKA